MRPSPIAYLVYPVLIVFLATLFISCGSSDVTKSLSAEERFELGKKKFDDGDYLEAISEFEIVKLQFPGSAVADDAQYYLGECHFQKEEHLLAAGEYQTLKRTMAASPLAPVAQYKIALCYYQLSPSSVLDQAYTVRAIDEFQNFIEYNPKHELAADAGAKITELNTRLARKLYDTAVLYMKMEYYKSASIYYGTVVEKYHDTEYAEPALLGLVRSYVARNKYDEARQHLTKFLDKYPQSNLRREAESLQSVISDHLRSKSDAVGMSSIIADRIFHG